MRINVHAGHCPDGKGASGAVGLIKESTENRKVKDEVIRLLRIAGHTVFDCTVDTNETKYDCLRKICDMANANDADFDLSIHFNDGVKDPDGNGRQTGTETWAKNYSGIKGTFADNYLANMQELGFELHGEGKKRTDNLYVLNKTTAPAVLIEVCFVNDKDDVERYKYVGHEAVARAVAEAIHGGPIVDGVEVDKLMAGDVLEVTADKIKIVDTSANGDKHLLGHLYRGAQVVVMKLNKSGSMAKLADGVWIYTKHTRKV